MFKVTRETATFTVCQLRLNAAGEYDVANKQHMNNLQETEEWFANVYGKFASVRVVCDQTEQICEYTDNGNWWERVK